MIDNKLIYTLNAVKQYLEFKKNETALNWLIENDVPIYNHGKRSKMVYQVDFESALLVPLAKNLIKSNPNTWRDSLKMYVRDEIVYDILLSKVLDTPMSNRPTTRIKPKNSKEEKLLKDLLS
ncbi:MAG: hypothetical protein ABNG98_10190 [Flavobacterium sp.]